MKKEEERQKEIDSFLDRVSGAAKECFLGYEDEDEDEGGMSEESGDGYYLREEYEYDEFREEYEFNEDESED